jgi:hypothetical protein
MIFPSESARSNIPSQKQTASRPHQPRKLTDEERRALFDNDRDRRMLNAWCAPRCDARAITAASVQSQSTCSLPSLVQTEIDKPPALKPGLVAVKDVRVAMSRLLAGDV